MCDQTEIPYKHGDVVWVKFGKCFWPGQVVGIDKLPEDVADCLKKNPIAVVQFFDEDQYEFVKNLDQISLYNGRRKLEFIKKGLDLFQNQKGKSTFMNKFPEDVKKAELLTGGNPNILTDPQLTPKEKSSYQGLFDGNKSSPKKEKAMAASNKRATQSPKTNGRRSTAPLVTVRTPRPITHPRFQTGETDHDVRIRDQSATKVASPKESEVISTPKAGATYNCHLCDFTSNRVNVIVLHNKFHSGEAANQVKGKGTPGKGKSSTPKARASLSTPVTKARANAKTKSVVDETTVSSPIPSSSKSVTSPKSATKRKMDVDSQNSEDKNSPTKAKVNARDIPTKKSDKSPEKVVDKKPSKVTSLGKRKLALAAEKAGKKSKNDEEIREQLLADWDDEDAEQEKKELEEILKKKLIEERVPKEVCCFDFDDSKDAILDSELEERAKKFVESRKIPREKVENIKDLPRPVVLDDIAPVDNKEADTASPEDFDKAIDSLLAATVVPELPQVPSGLLPDVVLDSSLAEANESKTDVPLTGEHDYSSRSLEDMAITDDGDTLDINSMPVVMTDDIITDEPSTSHVAVIEMPKIDLVPSLDMARTPAIVFSQEEIKMPTSVKSLVKAVRTSTADRSKLISKATVSQVNMKQTLTTVTRKITPSSGVVSKGIAAGKYIIVQSPSGQNSRLQLAATQNPPPQVPGKVTILSRPTQKVLTSAPPGQQKLITKISPGQHKLLATTSTGQKLMNVTGQQKLVTSTALPTGQQKVLTVTPKQPKFVTTSLSGQQKVLTITPKQQKFVTVTPTHQKLLPGLSSQPQLLMTSSGQILTQVTQKGLPAGSKFTPIRTIAPGTARQTMGPRLTMQSLQTKVSLPTLKPVARSMVKPSVRVMNPQARPILVHTTQSGPVATAPRMFKGQAAPAAVTQVVTKTMQAALRPKILQSRSTIQPKIVIQKPNTTMGIVSSMQQVTGLTTQPQIIQKITQVAGNTHLISQPKKTIPAAKRVTVNQPKTVMTIPRQAPQYTQLSQAATMPAASSNVQLITTQELPPLAPIQTSTIPSGNITLTLPQDADLTMPNYQTSSVATTGSTGLTSEQLAQVMASPQVSQMGDAGAGATYVLLTIDEAGNLQQLNNNQLISFDGTDGSGQTLYIDSSSLESGGDLENMILRIDNSGVGGALSLGESSSSWMPSPSQDILAAALANTDVFQPEVSLQDSCVVDTSSLLSSIPSTLLLPSLNRVVTTAANVSETSLTLNQPIMSPLEVTSSMTSFRAPPTVTTVSNLASVYAPISEPDLSHLVTEPAVSTDKSVAYHPSMPLLSEETQQYSEADGTVEMPLGDNLAMEVQSSVLSDESSHFAEAYPSGGDEVAAPTNADCALYPQEASNMDSLGSADDLGSLDNGLSNGAEAEGVPLKPDSSHSMPLLCDDSADNSGGQEVTEDNSESKQVAGDALEVVSEGQCEMGAVDQSGSMEMVPGDHSVFLNDSGDNPVV